jgi:predicted phosphodiesterase
MRAAVLADIHANLPALDAVLAEPDVAGADVVVLLGDIALGPMPAATLDRLAALGDRAVWVHGNCEREMVTAFDGGEVPGPYAADAIASAALIGRDHRDRLDRLPLTVTLEIDGLGPTLFCHASPRRDDEMLLVDSPPQRWARAPGSVGMPYGHPGAGWALLGPGVTLRQTRYDAQAAARVISASEHPGAREWAAEYVLNHYSDTEALEAFTEIARQQPETAPQQPETAPQQPEPG